MAVVTTQQSVAALYTAIFNRAPDQAGLNFWTAQINGGASFATIAEGFAQHEVFTTGIGALPNADYVNALYTNILGSAGDAAGIAYWTARLAAGESKASVVASFVEGSLTIDLPALLAAGSLTQADYDLALVRQQTLTNKADVGIYFANTLGAASNLNPATVSTSKAGLEADPIYKASQAAIAGVDSTAASVTTAQDAIAVAAGSPNPAQALLGQTFTLTPGADTFVGGASNDTFNALTIKADGSPATTLSAFDSIDGGAGNDTLNIYSDGVSNTAALAASATVKNVETININNSGTGYGAVDASKFVGATAINQVNVAGAVTNLAAGTVAGFNGVASTAAAPLSVSSAAGVASAAVNLTGVKGVDAAPVGTFAVGENTAGLKVSGAALNSVTVTGSLAQAVTSTVAGTEATLALEVVAGKDSAGKGLQSVAVNSAVNTALTVTDTSNTEKVTTVDASASTGAIAFTGDADAATIKTGAGADHVTLATATVVASAGVTAVDASVSTGSGNDTITIDTAKAGLATTTGATTVDAGAGDDIVNITSRSTGKLSVNLGDGNDTFTSAVAINGTDVIDAGAGTDTLSLKLVGAANIGAFSNFDAFDAAAMGKTLDVDILAAKNTVTEFVASDDVGANAALTNIGTGVNFRATGDMGTDNTLSLTQKTAGALTVTLDADSTSTTVNNETNLNVDATNATSLKAVFGVDSGFVQTSSTTNDQTITLSGEKATSLEVVSGGTNATNFLVYNDNGDDAGNGLLTSLTASGTQDLDISGLSATKNVQLTTINASALTGKLTADLAVLKAGEGTLTLGAGADTITATAAGSNADSFESIVNFNKAGAAAFGTDATAAATAIAAADQLVLTGASVVADNAAGTNFTISHGVLSFTGTGPSTLDAALAIADAAVTNANDAVEFEYLGNSYVFAQGTTGTVDADDTVVKLAGVVDVTHLVAGAADHFAIA